MVSGALVAVLCVAFVSGAVLGALLYSWSYSWRVEDSGVTGEVSVYADHYEVGYVHNVTARVVNNRDISTSGWLTVQINHATNGTVIASLFDAALVLAPHEEWAKSWSWTPTESSEYVAKADFQEA